MLFGVTVLLYFIKITIAHIKLQLLTSNYNCSHQIAIHSHQITIHSHRITIRLHQITIHSHQIKIH